MSTQRFAIFFKPEGKHAHALIEEFLQHDNFGTVDKLLGRERGQKMGRVIYTVVCFLFVEGRVVRDQSRI